MAIDLLIDDEVRLRFPDLRVFRLDVHGPAHGPALAALAARRVAEATAYSVARWPTPEALMAQPELAQWRDAYRAMGVKPSAFRCSFEALARRARAGKEIHTPVPAVDLYNAASLLHHACIGACDIDRLADAPLALRHCRPQEDRFAPLGGRAEDMPLSPGLVVYAQDHEVLCWGFNHRDSERACLRPESRRMLFVAEAVTADQATNAARALSSLAEDFAGLGFEAGAVTRWCG